MRSSLVSYDIFPTNLGFWGVAAGERGVKALTLPRATPAAAERRLLAEPALAGLAMERRPEALAAVRLAIERYSVNPAAPLDVALDLDNLTPFRRRVAEVARQIPPGAVLTYGEVAARAGRPGGARALGQAMGGNHVPLFVPCHRVVAAGGKLGGFGDGLTQKVRLLVHEGALLPGAVEVGGEPVGDPVLRVKRFLRLAGLERQVIQTGDSTRTAPEAAAALGLEVGQIAKSLLFVADGRPVLVVTSGDRRVVEGKLKVAVGATRTSLADPATVLKVTGFPVGGVSPVGHLHPAQVILDLSLQRFPVVYAAAGTAASALPLSFAELARVSGGDPADVC
ncbi:MAG: methylated-DNA--[protein]-cysteine S-methyltransferase [Chitinophagales bacterium]